MYDLILLGCRTVDVNANLSKSETNFTIDVSTAGKNELDSYFFGSIFEYSQSKAAIWILKTEAILSTAQFGHYLFIYLFILLFILLSLCHLLSDQNLYVYMEVAYS